MIATTLADRHVAPRIWQCSVTVRLLSPLHVGAGKPRALAIDAAIVRDKQDHPYVPASTIRGAMRAALDAILPLNSTVGRLWSCHRAVQEPTCPSVPGSGGYNALRSALAEHSGGESTLISLLGERTCTACRLFGTVWQPSLLHVSDGHFQEVDVRTTLRDINAIDRMTGVSHDNTHVVIETAESHQSFTFNIDAHLSHPQEELAFALLLSQGRGGFWWIGGKQRLGFGHCQVEGIVAHALNWPESSAAERQEFLLSGTLPLRDVAQFLQQQLALLVD